MWPSRTDRSSIGWLVAAMAASIATRRCVLAMASWMWRTMNGSSPIDALANAVAITLNMCYHQEYAPGEGKEASTACIVTITDERGRCIHGADLIRNTATAALNAVIAAINCKWR